MNWSEYLHLEAEHFSISAPQFAWDMATFLSVITGIALFYLICRVSQVRQNCRVSVKNLSRLAKKYPLGPNEGQPLVAIEELATVLSTVSKNDHCWNAYKSKLIKKKNSTDIYEYWAPERAEAVFTDETLTRRKIYWNVYSTIPGVVTGLGLAATFVAILIALLQVRVVENRVIGLELLIQGLSGKFVSSIAAIVLATIYLICEKYLHSSLMASRANMANALAQFVPTKSSNQLLSDLGSIATEQTNAFRTFNTSLAPMLKSSFSESVGPTLERMANSIVELNNFLKTAESQKQESITGSLESIMSRMEQSLQASITLMGDNFMKSMSGAANTNLDKMSQSLGSTAELLGSMNKAFEQTQSGLATLIANANDSTATQMRSGQHLVEEMAVTLKSLMVQLSGSTTSSMAQVQEGFANALTMMEEKVTQVTKSMDSAISHCSDKSVSASSAMLQQAEASTASANALQSQLLEKHQAQVELVNELRESLEVTLKRFGDTMNLQSGIVSSVGEITKQFATVADTIVRATAVLRDVSKSTEDTYVLANSQIQLLTESAGKQKEMWESIASNMEEYQSTFKQVGNTAGTLLSQINEQVGIHTSLTQQHYNKLVEKTDDALNRATKSLGGAIDELDEKLEEFTEVLQKHSPKS